MRVIIAKDYEEMSRKAANNPPGPAPTTTTCGLPATEVYATSSNIGA